MFLNRFFALFPLGFLFAFCMPAPTLASEPGAAMDDAFCSPSTATDRYVDADQIALLRTASAKNPPGAAFAGVRDDDRAILSESLRIGPGGGMFSARLLRDLAILDAFEQQNACKQADCPKPAIIAGFKSGEKNDPNADKSWDDLIALWKGFRDADAAKARACLQAAKSRPDLTVAVASAALPTPAKTAEAEHPAVPPHEPSAEQGGNAAGAGTAVGAAIVAPAPSQATPGCRESVSTVIGNRRIQFAKSSARIGPEDREFLGKVGPVVARFCGAAKIAVEGYADGDGPDGYNRRLSLERAEAVARALGVIGPSEHISIEGLGKAGPVAPNDSRAHKALNRRVEIHIR